MLKAMASMVSLSSITCQHHQRHFALHPKTLKISRTAISIPFIHSPHHIQLVKSGTPNPHPLVVFSTTTTTLSSSSSPSLNNITNFENYLVNSLGFSEQQSLSISTKLIHYCQGRVPRKVTDFRFENNADTVVNLLQQNGLDQSHIQSVVIHDPRILFANVDKTLKPKIDVLHEMGISGSKLAAITSMNPGLFVGSLSVSVKALREVLGSDEDVLKVFKKSSWNWAGSADKYLIPNVELLESYGVPRDRIRKAVLALPSVFMRPAELFRQVLDRVEEKWGIPRDSGAFIYALLVLSGFTEETIDTKCQVFKSFGWTDSDVLSLIRANPSFLSSSEAKIKNRLEFLMNELGYEPRHFASKSCMFTYSLEKRLVPRHRVLVILKDNGLLKKDYMLHSAVGLSESQFLERFVLPFKEAVPDLHEVYMKSQQSPHVLPPNKVEQTLKLEVENELS